MSAEALPSWEDHCAAALAMGLDVREAYETFDGPMQLLRRASKKCREDLEKAVADLRSL